MFVHIQESRSVCFILPARQATAHIIAILATPGWNMKWYGLTTLFCWQVEQPKVITSPQPARPGLYLAESRGLSGLRQVVRQARPSLSSSLPQIDVPAADTVRFIWKPFHTEIQKHKAYIVEEAALDKLEMQQQMWLISFCFLKFLWWWGVVKENM